MTYYGRWTYKYEKAAKLAPPDASSSTKPCRPAIRGKLCATVGAASSSILVAPDKNMKTARASKAGSRTSRRSFYFAPPALISTR